MEGNNNWFGDDKNIPSTSDRILKFAEGKAMFYITEASDDLRLDPKTVSKWIKRLVADGHVQSVDMTIPPTPEQSRHIQQLKENGLKSNHFKNAKWYAIVTEGESDES